MEPSGSPTIEAPRGARAALAEHIGHVAALVRAASPGGPPPDVKDPLGAAARATTAAIDDELVRAAVAEWANAYKAFWDATDDLEMLLADDQLRAGRHQKIIDAEIKWRHHVVAQRRAEVLAQTRTVLRALS